MNNFTKITTGWVRQYFEQNKDKTFVCIGQEFTVGDLCEYMNDERNLIDPQMHQYQPFNMVQPKSVQQQKDLLKAVAQYLADYTETEISRLDDQIVYNIDYLKRWIEQGIEAYQSTEDCVITVVVNKQ